MPAATPATKHDLGSPPAATAPNRASTAADRVAAMALEWMLTGGEDHSLVAAFPPGTPLPASWHLIGRALPGTGVTVDGAPHSGPTGWQHFR